MSLSHVTDSAHLWSGRSQSFSSFDLQLFRFILRASQLVMNWRVTLAEGGKLRMSA